MAQVLVTSESAWYQGIASLKNIYEKNLEHRVLKFSKQIFTGYHGFQSAFVFNSKLSDDTAASDMLLIAEDFSQWVIVELELMGKQLKHTKKQLRVFSEPRFEVEKLVKHCISKDNDLVNKENELGTLFTDHDPDLLVIFDTYHKSTLEEISSNFTCKICVLEIYRTMKHDFELYRMSGDYPYINTGFSFLKNWPTNFDQYEIEKPGLFNGITLGTIQVYHKMFVLNALLMNAGQRYFLKIPQNPFPPGDDLKVFRTIDDKLIIEKL